MQHFCHHRDTICHPNSSYITTKLHGTSTCGCNNYTKLQITYHNILKRNIALSKYESTRATCTFTNTQCCQSTIRNLLFKFVSRLNKSDNALIKALLYTCITVFILGSSVAYSSRIHSYWRRLLYMYQSITFEASDRSRLLPLALIHILASELSLAPIHEKAR